MARNANLHAAKHAKNDEFFTRREDIENELHHYAEHFKGKVVYCNCDDPTYSEFWQFFVRNFTAWGLKKLIATHYEPNAENFSYKLEIEPDEDGQFSIFQEPVKTPLPCNGDFRSAACIELLKEADIVVTNPPFSLFREYVAQLIEYDKKFVIMGNKNAITYKEFFPLLKENKVWVGATSLNGGRWMIIPDWIDVQSSKAKIVDGKTILNVAGVCWYTNLENKKRSTPLDMRGVYYDPEKYPKYDNYDGINIDKIEDIPSDYFGIMGVPVTFMNNYCPEQFEILGITLGNTVDYPMERLYEGAVQHNKDGTTQGGSKVNTRAAILVKEKPTETVFYTASNADGYLLSIYPRILIRRKQVQK